MTAVRLLADDLTGALDAAAELVGLAGPIPVFWHGAAPSALQGHAALDSGSREMTEPAARQAVATLAPALHGAGIAFKKVDSLLRGHTLAELAACLQALGGPPCVLAPAFPFQGRTTRGGQQYLGDAPVGPNLVAAVRALGLAAQDGQPGSPLPGGVTVFDATTQAELDAIAARHPGTPVLWCGTGGLAQALAQGHPAPGPGPLPRPILGLFGSDQAVTAWQLAACHPHWLAVPDATPVSIRRVAATLDRHGIAAVSHALAPKTSRAEAALRIEAVFRGLVGALAAPGTLVAAGGETLRGLCLALGATSLDVQGSVMPGVPVSILRGGRWDGVTVVSKSGAFGHRTLLRELFRLPDLNQTSTTPGPIGSGSALERAAS